jgi:DNA repair photolyase
VDAVRSQLSHGKITGKKIMLCFTCDPYPIGHDSVTTREIIKAIKESGNYVQILTKGYETAQRDFDLLDAGDSFGVTISGDRGEWEPIAKDLSLRAWRVINIAAAHSRGIKTWVSCEPVLEPEAIYGSIKSMSELVDLWRIGKLNHCKSDIDWYVFGHEVEGLCKSLNVNYYIKEDLRKEMEVKWK